MYVATLNHVVCGTALKYIGQYKERYIIILSLVVPSSAEELKTIEGEAGGVLLKIFPPVHAVKVY